MRERQPLVVPGWTLGFEDLMFFLDVKRTGNQPAIYLEVANPASPPSGHAAATARCG
jgi:ABC transport system ATP-binding/permease protein